MQHGQKKLCRQNRDLLQQAALKQNVIKIQGLPLSMLRQPWPHLTTILCEISCIWSSIWTCFVHLVATSQSKNDQSRIHQGREMKLASKRGQASHERLRCSVKMVETFHPVVLTADRRPRSAQHSPAGLATRTLDSHGESSIGSQRQSAEANAKKPSACRVLALCSKPPTVCEHVPHHEMGGRLAKNCVRTADCGLRTSGNAT